MTDKSEKSAGASIKRLREAVRQREAEQLIQLPLWPEPKRGTPNSFIRSALFAAIQSKDRVFLKESTVASQKGITVKFTGEQLNQEDLSVWETLAHLAREHPLGHLSEFSAHSLLKSLGLHTGLSQHKQLHSTIVRLTACAVEITHEGKTYFGSLVKSGIKDEITSHYKVELNRELIRLFGDNQWTALDWRQRQKLRGKHLAQVHSVNHGGRSGQDDCRAAEGEYRRSRARVLTKTAPAKAGETCPRGSCSATDGPSRPWSESLSTTTTCPTTASSWMETFASSSTGRRLPRKCLKQRSPNWRIFLAISCESSR